MFDESGRSQKKPIHFDVLTDLIPFESKADLSQPSSCYKADAWEFISAEAFKINQRFQEYRQRASKVEVTEKNVVNSLFTLCTFDNFEGQKRKGVLMQARYDSQLNTYQLLMR